jgi:sortase A
MSDTPTQPTSRRTAQMGDGAGFLIDALRARPVARRMLSGLSVVLAVIGLGMLAYPFTTNLYQGRLQTKLAIQLKTTEAKQAYETGQTPEGEALTRIVIPAIEVNTVVVEGTGASALRAGAGHYPNTPLPGEEGNVAIAGHRTTYGKPFANLDHLKPGDVIVLETPIGKNVYKVSLDPFVVPNTQWDIISQTPGHTLTLTTCHPKGSAKQRLVVKAEML